VNMPRFEDVGATLFGPGKLGEIDVGTVIHLFQKSSAVLFRGFEAGQDQFRLLSKKMSKEFITHLNFTRQPYGDRTLTSVSPGHDHFFAHAEMGYVPFRPDVAWFYCERPARKGGETTIYDGVEVLKRLRADTRALFEQKRILFQLDYPSLVWSAMAPDKQSLSLYLCRFDKRDFSYEFDKSEHLHLRYVTSAITTTRYGAYSAFCNSLLDSKLPLFEDQEAIPKDALYDVISVTEELSIPVTWRAGDVLMLDNSRFMHGRREFEDEERQVLVRFSNVAF
jgi:alpha-ketoglutarate-dependent taurine dioxygenase